MLTIVKAKMWKVTPRKEFDNENVMVSLIAEQPNGQRFMTGSPVWILPFEAAKKIFMNDLKFLPEAGEEVEVKLAVEPVNL
jgi:hypothetical protein